MRSAPIRGNTIVRAHHLPTHHDSRTPHGFKSTATCVTVEEAWTQICGSILQLSGPGVSTFAGLLIRTFQCREERPVAYVSGWENQLFPPDLSRIGVSLRRLLVLLPEKAADCIWGVDTLLRSGQFGLIIFEAPEKPRISLGAVSRLSHIVRRYGVTLAIITEETQPLLASAVAVHGEVSVEKGLENGWRLVLQTHRNRISLPSVIEDIHDNTGMCAHTRSQTADSRSAS